MVGVQTYRPFVSVYVAQADPTKTTALRNAFAKEMKKRFQELTTVIRKTVEEEDVFGLKKIKIHGGEGSGNFGHAGRPGEVGGSSTSPIIEETYLDNVDAEIEVIDAIIEKMDEEGTAGPGDQIYDANSHIGTVLEQYKEVPLSSRKYWRFVFYKQDDKIIAAGSIEIEQVRGKRGDTAEIMNVGSLVKGQGSKVVSKLCADVKDLGVRHVRLISTAKSFYEKLGFELKDDGYMHKDLQGIQTDQMQPARKNEFAFSRSADKVKAFMDWLQEQVNNGILQVKDINQVGTGIDVAWTNKFIYDSYKRGVIRARYELNKNGYVVPGVEETGGMTITLGTPVHLDRLGLLYTRAYNELKGITNSMDKQISQVLSQGIADGDNPRLLARKLVSTINGEGVGELGITDTLGRFIPAARRAEILARTEIIRAHHKATIQEYKNWKAEGVFVEAEWRTAGDDRVCPECEKLEGVEFTLDDIENKIPLHPQCRCLALPKKVKPQSTKGEVKKVTEPTSVSKLKTEEEIKTFFNQYKVQVEGAMNSLPRTNEIASQLEQMMETVENLKAKVQRSTMMDTKVIMEVLQTIDNREGVLGEYNSNNNFIRIARAAALQLDTVPTIGRHTVGQDLGTVFRHEYGHHIYFNLLSKDSRGAWIGKWTNLNVQEMQKTVSVYGATNVKEYFAECFAAYTSPGYTMGTLPEEIETLLGWTIGKRIK